MTPGTAVHHGSEIALVAALMAAYVAGRRLVEGDAVTAFANAATIVELERSLGIDVESDVHRLVASRPRLATVSAQLYLWTNWVTVVAGMVIVRWRDEHRYRVLRTGLALSAAVGLLCAWLVPVAPPRLLDGFDDIVYGPWDPVSPRPPGGSNVYAAFPSFHVGWPALVGLATAATFRRPDRRRPLRWAALAPAVLLAAVVVATANHFVVDVIGGVAIASGSEGVVRRYDVLIGPGRTAGRTTA